MKHRFSLLIIALSTVSSAWSAPSQTSAPLVVLISVDGLKPEAILEAPAHGLKVPHLRAFMTEGVYANGVRGVLPTVTYPSHTTLITGASPARHGVYDNTTFDPLARNERGWYWYAEDIKVPTLWDAAAAAQVGEQIAINDTEIQTELVAHFLFPLHLNRGLANNRH